ncbi:hypothetical protein DESA109040_05535 [Deinococcus saxicola]
MPGGVFFSFSLCFAVLQVRSYGLRLKGVKNTWKSEGSEKEKNGFRTWSVEIGAARFLLRYKRNPYQMFIVFANDSIGVRITWLGLLDYLAGLT